MSRPVSTPGCEEAVEAAWSPTATAATRKSRIARLDSERGSDDRAEDQNPEPARRHADLGHPAAEFVGTEPAPRCWIVRRVGGCRER